MEQVLALIAQLGCGGAGVFLGMVLTHAAVRSAGYRLQYQDHAWSITRLPQKGARTMRSLN